MHGDFSLNPLAYRDRVSRVLSQQGRVPLDSDANEQTESLLRYLRLLGADVIGPHGGLDTSFEVFADATSQLFIRWGIYYVDGIRCLNFPVADVLPALADPAAVKKFGEGLPFLQQPDLFPPKQGPAPGDQKEPILFYLDVFERHVSSAEDDSIREVALLGPDTTSRAVIVWQVKWTPATPFNALIDELTKNNNVPKQFWDVPYVALNLLLRSSALLRAQAIVSEATDPCTISPDAKYRGTENRLFRVEIHDPGDVAGKKPATFKWSPDNGSIVYPIRLIEGTTVHLDSLGRDDRTAIQINDWVEVVDDVVLEMGKVNPLLQVIEVRPSDMTVTLSAAPADNAGGDPKHHPILRRWAAAAGPLREAKPKDAKDAWVELADGVEVQFSRADNPRGGYRTGDYWLIPTRTATGDVIWPKEADGKTPAALPPHGVDHHYAPLEAWDPRKNAFSSHYRRTFQQISKTLP
jgi:hypothetical protein